MLTFSQNISFISTKEQLAKLIINALVVPKEYVQLVQLQPSKKLIVMAFVEARCLQKLTELVTALNGSNFVENVKREYNNIPKEYPLLELEVQTLQIRSTTLRVAPNKGAQFIIVIIFVILLSI